MKLKILLLMLALGLIVSSFAQKATIELTFTAGNNGQYVPLDSIKIENLAQGGDTTLYAPDTVLVLDYYVTSIGDKQTIRDNSFFVSQNYPNPFNVKTEFNLYLPENGFINISVSDISGRELAQYENTLNRGNHTFSFYSGNGAYYLLTVTGKQTSKTIKMVSGNNKTNNGGKCKLVYNGHGDIPIGFKSQQNVNDFAFNMGDSLQYTGYAKSTDGIFGSAVIQDTPQESTIYLFDILKGLRCPGTPTVTDIDGNTYNTVQIGNQCWMAENLRTNTFNNGVSIPNVTDNWQFMTTAAYVWYDNDISWKDLYGAIYNWYAVDDPNGLCPTNWHTPSYDEWTALTDYIGGTASPHGNELKSCRQVNSLLGGGCNTTEHPRWNESGENGTDDFGFSGLPGGSRINASFFNLGYWGSWWTSTAGGSPLTAGIYGLSYSGGTVNGNYTNKWYGLSVRCLRD